MTAKGSDDRRTTSGASSASRLTARWEMTASDHDMMTRFRRDFLDLLDGRVAKIESLVLDQQTEPAHVALLSLESSSAMVGATELAASVRHLRTELSAGRVTEVSGLLDAVVAEADRARRQLETSGR